MPVVRIVSQTTRDLAAPSGLDFEDRGLHALKGIDGRRVILIFTDGDDTSSRIGRGTVLDRARNEEVMVYAIGLESDYFDEIGRAHV